MTTTKTNNTAFFTLAAALATAFLLAAPAEAKEQSAPSSSVLEQGDAKKGKRRVVLCKGCHTLEEGGRHKSGPNLWNIIGRKPATAEGYEYSDALKALDGAWTPERLDAFLKKPQVYLPGTKMAFGGFTKNRDRANVIAYLRSVSATPTPVASR